MCSSDLGNPSAMHQKGVDAEGYVKESARTLAQILKVTEKEILFTSGGTESNNLALIGGALANKRSGNHIITTAVEHAAVSQPVAFLQEQGFTVVEYVRVTGETLPAAVAEFAEKIVTNDFPSDGLVLLMDEIAYGESLGTTAKFPRNAMAFKWADEMRDTRLLEIEWSPSRTGLINPVAIFEPVELEGTTVSRASVHNVSIVKELELGIGDIITVYKANMIIPQIAENMTRSGTLPIPEECPVCHSATAIHEENGVKALFCENASCPAKKIKSFSHFVSRDAMNIDGMSEATIEKLMNQDMIHEPADLFRLDRYKDQIIAMDGFGEKSYEKMVQSATKAAHTTIIRFLYSFIIDAPAN